MTSTVLDIINRALRLLGVAQTGETAPGSEAQDAFKALNWMLGQWANEKLLVYAWLNEVFTLTASSGTYSIGDNGDIDTTRPNRIERAFIRYAATGGSVKYDYQLEIIPNGRFEEIFLKSLETTYPQYLTYNPTYPLGQIRLWPVPAQACELGISQWAQVSDFTGLNQVINLPPGYETALAYNLAVELMAEYGVPDQLIIDKAIETKMAIMRTNTEKLQLKTDSALLPKRSFNIYSGSYN